MYEADTNTLQSSEAKEMKFVIVLRRTTLPKSFFHKRSNILLLGFCT